MPFDNFVRGGADEVRAEAGFLKVGRGDNGVSVFAGD